MFMIPYILNPKAYYPVATPQTIQNDQIKLSKGESLECVLVVNRRLIVIRHVWNCVGQEFRFMLATCRMERCDVILLSRSLHRQGLWSWEQAPLCWRAQRLSHGGVRAVALVTPAVFSMGLHPASNPSSHWHLISPGSSRLCQLETQRVMTTTVIMEIIIHPDLYVMAAHWHEWCRQICEGY